MAFNPTLPYATAVNPDADIFLLQQGNVYDQYGNRWVSPPNSINGATNLVALNEMQIQILQGQAATIFYVDPTLYPYNLSYNTPDSTAVLQTIINTLHAAVVSAMAAGIPAYGVLIIRGTFKICSFGLGLSVPGTVSFIGNSSSDAGFIVQPGAVQDAITLTPYDGRSGGVRRQQYMTGFKLDGNIVAINKITGTVDSTSGTPAVVTGVSSTVNVNVGDIIEARGIPKNDSGGVQGLVSVSAKTSNTITLTTNAVNKPAAAANKIITRRAYTKTCISDGTTGVLLCSDTSNIVVGMKTYGANLSVDSTDLSQWSIVTAVVQNTSITLDTPTVIASSFSCQFFIAPGGIRVQNPNMAPNYNSNKNYEAVNFYDVHVTQMSFHGWANRGRPQCHVLQCKSDANYGYGVYQSGAADTYFRDFISGSNNWSALFMASSATPRWNGEYYDTYLNDRYEEIIVRGCREWHMDDSDINGRVYVRHSQNTTNGIAQISNCNFKFQLVDQLDATAINSSNPSAYVISDGTGTVLQVSGSGFKGDDNASPSSLGRPNYIASSQNGGLIAVSGMQWADFPTGGVDQCPYNTAQCDVPANFFSQYVQVGQGTYTGRLIQAEGTWTPTITFVTAGDLSVVYTAQIGRWSYQNGWMYLYAQLAFTPTYTTASGNFQIRGQPVSLNSDLSSIPLSAIIGSSGSVIGSNGPNISARCNGNSITLEQTGFGKNKFTVNAPVFPTGVAQTVEIWGLIKV